MSVRIRLNRVGKKHVPFFRIVAIDSRKKRDGAFLADLGTYDTVKSSVVRFDVQGFDHWVSVGAQPSASVKKIVKEHKKTQKAVAAPVAEKKVKKAAPKPKKAAAAKEEKSDS